MTKQVQGARIIHKYSETSSIQPTIPSNNDHTSGWLGTDIYKGELYMNLIDNKIFTRTDSGIVKILTNSGDTSIGGDLDVSGNISGTTFYGDGSNLTGIDSSNWNVNGDDIKNKNTGNVGIGLGVYNPTHKLHVNGDIFILNDNTQNDTILISTDEGTKMIIKYNGNVGIGTDTPTHKLHVNGDTLVEGDLNVSGNISGTTFYGDGSNLTGIDESKWTSIESRIHRNSKVVIGTGVYGGLTDEQLILHNTSGVSGIRFISDTTGQSKGWTIGTGCDVGLMNTSSFYIHNLQNSLLGLSITSGNSVGVGTSTPSEKLHVSGNTLIDGDLNVNGNISGTTFYGDGSNLTGIDASNWTVSGNDIYNKNTGNVGIGTSTPSEKLYVKGSFKQDLPDGNNSFVLYDSPNGTDALQINSNDYGNMSFIVDSANEGYKVGVGVLNPTEKLHVSGNTLIEGNIEVSGSTISNDYNLSDLNTAPSSASDTGTKGEIRITSDAIYVCIDTNTWVKADLATWT